MEMLIRVVDRGDHPLLTKAGDIVTVQEDGWSWSKLELANPHWRIIRAPILGTHAVALQKHGRERRRDWAIDLAKLPRPLELGVVNEFTRAEIVAATVQK